MSRLSHLREQVARAERLANCITDPLTIERLRAFAAECEREIERLTSQRRRAAASAHTTSSRRTPGTITTNVHGSRERGATSSCSAG